MTPVPPHPPSRSPRRLHTVLLAAVVVLLTAILIVLVVNTGDDNDTGAFDDSSSASDDANLDARPEDPKQAVHRFMSLVMVDRDTGDAEKLMCDDYQGLTPADLLKQLTDWESDNDVRANTMVAFEDDTSQSRMTIEVKLETGANFVTWLYEVTVERDGDSFQVCEVRSTSPGD